MKKKLRIGLLDQLYFCLQHRLLAEGHELTVCVPDLTVKLPPEIFATTPPVKGERLVQVTNIEDLLAADCDLYIIDSEADEQNRLFETLRAMGKPVFGWSGFAQSIERNRSVGRWLVEQTRAPIKLTECVQCNSTAELIDHLNNRRDKQWVVKVTSNPHDGWTNFHKRTAIVHDPDQFISSTLGASNAWFDENGNGSCFVEEFIEGYEIAFSVFFDGEEFGETCLVNQEYKGAQNGNRGGMLTGEVGSVFKVQQLSVDSPLGAWLDRVSGYIRGQMVGCFDVNTIVDANGDHWLLEFTTRMGRPTLEMIVGCLEPKANFGIELYNLAIGSPMLLKTFVPGYHVGVAVFTYGHPNLGSAPEQTIKFQMPDAPYAGSEVVQFFARYSREEKCWVTRWDERQFIVVGSAENLVDAINRAYSGLTGYHLHNHTWRDDIGAMFEPAEQASEKLFRTSPDSTTEK